MKYVIYYSVLFAALLAAPIMIEAKSALDSETVGKFGGNRVSVQRTIALIEYALDRAITVSNSRDSYPSLSDEQYRDLLAGHYHLVISKAKIARERLLEANETSQDRRLFIPKVGSILTFHEQISIDMDTMTTTADTWKRVILEVNNIFEGREGTEK